jgi:hypothetical protein
MIIVVPGIFSLPKNSEGPEKKLLTGCFERTISRPRRRRRNHRRGSQELVKAFAADFEQDTGQEPGYTGEWTVSLFLIVG